MTADAGLIWRFLSQERAKLALAVALALGEALALVPIGLLVQRIFATDIPQRDSGGVVRSGLLILLLYVISAGLALLSARLTYDATARATARLRTALLARLVKLPLSWHGERSAGTLPSEITNHAQQVEMIASPIVVLGQSLLVAPALLVVAVVVSPVLLAVAILTVPVLIVVGIVLRRRLAGAVGPWHNAWMQLGAFVTLMLRTISLVQSRAAEPEELRRASALVDELAQRTVVMSWRQSLFSVSQGAIAGLAGALILVVGSLLVVHGNLALADLLAFYAVIGLLLRTIAGGSGSAGHLVSGIESLRTLFAIVDEPAEAAYPRRGAPPPCVGEVALAGVSFGYEADAVLRDVDLHLARGERVALVGPNGAGKSTVASLMLGLYRPWSGRLTAGGVAYDDLDIELLRRRIGFLAQEPMLRPGTVAENIAFGRAGTDAAAVGLAAERAGLADLAIDLDASVGEDGERLSGGERQRVALARAILGDPELLILDEPTNHLDADAVQHVLARLGGLGHRPTVLVITHDQRLMSWAQRSFRLEAGALR